MPDILEDLRAIARTGGDTYSSAEVIGVIGRAVVEIERLWAALEKCMPFNIDTGHTTTTIQGARDDAAAP